MLSYQHEMAARCFLACLQYSPDTALAHGLVALCHAPNYNFKGDAYYESAHHPQDAGLHDLLCVFPSQQVADRHSKAAIDKIEHLRKHANLLPALRDTGCLFVVSAVEAIDDDTLVILDKGHTQADFIQVVQQMRQIGLPLTPTFVTFTPWTTVRGYAEFLALMAEMNLVGAISPIQYAIRLLIPAGSRLLECAEVQDLIRPFDEVALVYPWTHPDPAVDALYETVFKLVKASQNAGESRQTLFNRIWQAVIGLLPETERATWAAKPIAAQKAAAFPTLSESWY